MSNVLIVHAHHEPASFCSSLAGRTAETLAAQGHEIAFSDLSAMHFQPVSDRRNFTTAADPSFLKQQREEAFASDHNGFAPELEEEIRKLERCDLLIFTFPPLVVRHAGDPEGLGRPRLRLSAHLQPQPVV